MAAGVLAQGPDLPATVMPFILRDVTLAGVNSVLTPREKREEAWGRLATDLDFAKLNSMTSRAETRRRAGFGDRSSRGKNARAGGHRSPTPISEVLVPEGRCTSVPPPQLFSVGY